MNKLMTQAIALFVVHGSSLQVGAATIYSDRQSFRSSIGAYLTDDYEHPNYQHVMTDAEITAVLGETGYYTYGGNVTDYNNIMPTGFGVDGSQAYCSLCYGNFRLSFGASSLADSGSIFGVGLDITVNSGGQTGSYGYSALVTFGDDSTALLVLPYVADMYPSPPDYRFWGITSELGISSIDFIGYANSGEDRTYFIMDNLTIATSPIPVPPAMWLMAAGLGGLVGAAARGTWSRSH